MTDLKTLEDIVAARRRLWCGDPRRDKDFINYAAKCILQSDAMCRKLAAEPYLLIEAVMQVVDKNQRLVPFFLNEVQRRFLQAFRQYGTAKPYFVLKGRQQGFTTLITAMQLCYCLAKKHFAGFTIADNLDNMNAIFTDKAKAMYDNLPACLKPRARYNSRRELVFDGLDSSWRVGAAGENIGRSRTLHFVHYSEVAFYKCAPAVLQRSIGEALTSSAVQIYETTANGWNATKELWDSGVCVNLFFPWWLTDEYRALLPLSDTCDKWLAERLQWLRQAGLDDKQCAWYAAKYNTYLDKSGIMQEYPCSAEEAWVSSAECEFGRDSVLNRLRTLPPNRDMVGYFDCRMEWGDYGQQQPTDIRWVDDPNGCIRIHRAPTTRTQGGKVWREPYAIGADTAGEGSDWYAAKVVSAHSGDTVATMHIRHTDDDLFARQLYCLGRHYHDAMIGVEINFSLAPVRLLQQWEYPNLYTRERFDALTGRAERRAGFCTNAHTRPVVLSELKALWRDNNGMECDKETLLEMLSFVKNSEGRPEAARGKHDDLVMALAIAHHVATVCGREWAEQAEDAPDWLAQHFRLPP